MYIFPGEYKQGQWKSLRMKRDLRPLYFALVVSFLALVVLMWGARMASVYEFNNLILS